MSGAFLPRITRITQRLWSLLTQPQASPSSLPAPTGPNPLKKSLLNPDLSIWYASHQNRLVIEKIIAGETFYGIAYRLQNR
jgi:hypothetical protein